MPELKDIRAGDQKEGAAMIRLIEDNDPVAFDLLKELYPYSGNAFVIGITGSPGVGKSTLIDALITQFRQKDLKVAVIAVDPSSPVSGGAILGDRLRMQRHAADDKVFIRSMASRGQKGGLSRATKDAAVVLDVMGYDIIIVETVGAGQGEFEITTIAHSIGIVSIPGTGDGIQAVKAGILETGDVFIVNKCDKPDADVSVAGLSMMLDMRNPVKNRWRPRVIKTCAHDKTGLKELVDTFLAHLAFMKENGVLELKRKDQEQIYFQSLLKELILDKILTFAKSSPVFEQALNHIQTHRTDPVTAAEQVACAICGTIGND